METKESKLTQQQLLEIASRAKFRGGLHVMKSKMTGLSNRGIKRAITAALCHSVEPAAAFNFQNRQEAELAGVISQLLDIRTILQSIDYKKETSNDVEEMGKPRNSKDTREDGLRGELRDGELCGIAPIGEDPSGEV